MKTLRTPRLWFAALLVSAYLGLVGATDRSAAAMADAATKWLAALTPQQRQHAAFSFDAADRLNWHFVPTEMHPRKGLTLGEMTDSQRTLAHDLLRAGLSQRGYMTAAAIMELESILGAIEAAERRNPTRGRGGNPMARDPVRYFFSVFGMPSSRGAWAWRVEGHHVSLNFTIVNGSMVASSPSFFGSNPAEVKDGPRKGLRLLAAEEDTARALLAALDEQQRARAVISATAPSDIATMNQSEVEPLTPVGVASAGLSAAQRDLLMKVIEAYTSAMAPDVAADRMARLRQAGLEKIAFAWAGEGERGKRHYYRVQGPTFLIEYDNTQNDANHIHSVWRDFIGDFGRDLLRDHLKSAAH